MRQRYSFIMHYFNSIIETIGNTPLVKLNRVTAGIKGTILAKVEYFNPGNSVKDRMAVKMIEDAEEAGILQPGGTIIEGTSGNTGMGLALAAIAKGYKCIFTMPDKQSKEKMDILRAVGAEVVVTPTNVTPEDPRSYYSVARRLNQEIPNSFYPNQYDNLSNAAAHYENTGPEIWEQTQGKITHFAAGVGTGGTMCGTAKYLKEQNPAVYTVGIDTWGSVFKKYKETSIFDDDQIYGYATEGIGEDILPKNVDFSMIDHFTKVTDKDAALMTRRLAKEEGLFVGWSCGSAVAGALAWAKDNLKEEDVMVIILPDHGTRYLGKVYNNEWMQQMGYLESGPATTVEQALSKAANSAMPRIDAGVTVEEAAQALLNGPGYVAVYDGKHMVGSLSQKGLLAKLITNQQLKTAKVSQVLEPALKQIAPATTLDTAAAMLDQQDRPVFFIDESGNSRIITRADVLQALT